MNTLLNWIGWLFGWILWAAYCIIPNFAIAILIFTIILRIIQFPFQIKSQKAMAGSARLQRKQQALQEKYGKDKRKFDEEVSKLYEKENVNPLGGCTSTLVPMVLLFGVYWTIRNPITNTLHIAADKVEYAVNYVLNLPVVGTSINQYYSEIEVLKYFENIRASLIFNGDEIEKIEKFCNSFSLLGLNLLESPNMHGYLSLFTIIPVLCFVSSFSTSVISMKINGNSAGMGQQQGCMKAMFLFMPLFSAWIAFSVPAAVGLYWIYSNIIGLATTFVIHKFYNAETMTASEEARRIALLEVEEANVRVVSNRFGSTNSAKQQKKKKKK